MIPPNQGSSLSLDSSQKRTPRENCYILGYEGPNEISQDFPYRGWNVLFVVKVSNPKGEKVTHGSLYKFAMLNSIEINHLGKTLISTNW